MNLAFIQGIGPLELVIVLIIVLLIFGPKRLPALARSASSGIRELRRSVAEKDDESDGERAESTNSAQAALGRPDQPVLDARPVEGEVVSDRR